MGKDGIYAHPIGTKSTLSAQINPDTQPEIWEQIFVEDYLNQTEIKKNASTET
ncbi:hypothetical protein [Candidatus Williamhamiltonella defendens]|uniref:hypothetical protein n=1 Tax=Candidatus Williamhamiltonella defendens TaxID=138072 RepID=UPI001651998E|nr:hypothetical protein [Candidatus Hamiltonella defensa]